MCSFDSDELDPLSIIVYSHDSSIKRLYPLVTKLLVFDDVIYEYDRHVTPCGLKGIVIDLAGIFGNYMEFILHASKAHGPSI